MQKISISDITIPSADQSGEISLSFKEKIELARLLDKLNVPVIELSPIKNAKIDSLLIKSVAAAVTDGVVAVPVNREADGVEAAWAALKDAKHPRLQVRAPMSPAQMEYFWHKKPPVMLEAIRDLVTRCRALCADVEFVADDACRAEREFLVSAVSTAIGAGATTVTFTDAAGQMLPDEFSAFLADVKTRVPELENVRLGVCCSDALSMGVACAMAALRVGATEIKAASLAGTQLKLRPFAAALAARGGSFGAETDLRTTELTRITDQIERMCRPSRTGKSSLDTGSAAPVADSDIVLSANDDRAAVLRAVKELGYELSEEDSAKVWEAFGRIASRKNSISARELDTIVATDAMQAPATYRLVHYVVNCGNMISASAHLKLDKAGEILEGICLGDGPIDAAFLAVSQIVGSHYELDDFQIQSVTEGREAMGETLVRLRSNGRLYSGRGISTDIVGASIRAYLNALNKIVYEEAEA